MLNLLNLVLKREKKNYSSSRYNYLEKHRDRCHILENAAEQLIELNKDYVKYGISSNDDAQTVIKEIDNIIKKLRSPRFRIAVVGEFSRGKSTLLNAMLGEEIQPVRANPCSGTVTVLKYGPQKRVVCLYKNGKSEQIPLDQYKKRAAISEEAALGSISELVKSDIQEIVFEHPDLNLCRSGIEIVDSPGLNEHPDRTAITAQVIKDTDAIIFLANASQPLTQGERELIRDIKTQLNNGNAHQPAKNLFVVVNFMDQLRHEEDRQSVRQRFKKLLQSQEAPIIVNENQIHFISARAALDAIQEGNEDNYLQDFRKFIKSLEDFLTDNRGFLMLEQSVIKLKHLIQRNLNNLDLADRYIDNKILSSAAEKQKLLELMGEVSAINLKIEFFTNDLFDKLFKEVNQATNLWREKLDVRLRQKSYHWYSNHNVVFSREELVKDYINSFNRDLTSELNTWINDRIEQGILKEYLEIIDNTCSKEIQEIKERVRIFFVVNRFNRNLPFGEEFENGEDINNQLNPESLFYEKLENSEGFDVVGSIGLAGMGAAVLIPSVFAGPILLVIGTLLGGALIGLGLLNGAAEAFNIDGKIKDKILEDGLKNLWKSWDNIYEKMVEEISKVIAERIARVNRVIASIIYVCDKLSEQQQKEHLKYLEKLKNETQKISQKRNKIKQIEQKIDTLLN